MGSSSSINNLYNMCSPDSGLIKLAKDKLTLNLDSEKSQIAKSILRLQSFYRKMKAIN